MGELTRSDDGRVTMSDVAERAGVSVAAVSLALRGRPGVGEDTRRRVEAVASEMGYRSRSSAVAAGPSIGLLVKGRPDEMVGANAFYGPVIAGVTEAAAAAGVDVRLDSLLVDEQFKPVRSPRLLDADDVDGLLVLGAYLSDESGSLAGDRPLVLVDGYSQSDGVHARVGSDNHAGTKRATEHLLGLGHRRIVMAGSTPDAFPSIRERRAGYTSAMRSAELAPAFVDGHHTQSRAVAADVAGALERDRGITAVVAANDEVAIAILAALGGRVPDEVSVVGFDDIEGASVVSPGLDTIAIDKPAMGRLAVSILLHRLRFPADPPSTSIQPATLIVRGSSAPPR